MRTKTKKKARKKSRRRGAFPFLNCDQPLVMTNQAKLFCSEPCAEEAKSVRYARRCIRDGRIELPDVRDAIEIRLGMVLSGGYPERERLVSRVIRQAVIA